MKLTFLGADREVRGHVCVECGLDRRQVVRRFGHVEVEPALFLADLPDQVVAAADDVGLAAAVFDVGRAGIAPQQTVPSWEL